ncbi:MAG: SDR family NAD(P)-dependent oxidoreductase, partial [Planctomycetes bacterium]|nr:SDR family NAD(P)-dependent oxidoreductase [Planctomycetota bacterium]
MILDQFKLDGRVAIVTGGTTGLGQAICVALAEAGADIACVAASGRFAETQPAVEQTGRRFLGIQADLAKMESIPRIVEQVRRAFGRIDILFNNAGIIRRTP